MRASLPARRRELLGMLLGWRLRRMHLMPLLCLSMKRFDTQDTEETPNCYMEEKVINDVTCTNTVEFNCRREKTTKNDGYGQKEVICTRTPKQDCYQIPRKVMLYSLS